MVKYLHMKFAVPVLFVLFSFSAFAAAWVVVPQLPEAMRPLAEVETNVAFSVGAPCDNLWKLSIELDASTSNCVEVVLGTDADEDGERAWRQRRRALHWMGLRRVVLARQARKRGMPRRGNGPAP